jgi:hypothetical protein
MEVGLAVLADSANVSREGKLNILGIFDRVMLRQIPGPLPPMQLVLRLEARPDDLGSEHTVRVRLVGPEGQPLFDINGTFTPRARDAGQDVAVNQIINFSSMPLQQVGRHRVLVFVGDALKREIPLTVVQAPQPPKPPGGTPPGQDPGPPTVH